MKTSKKMPIELDIANLPLTPLTALSPLDGRYWESVKELSPYVSEWGLIRARFEVEARYLVALSEVDVVRHLSADERDRLNTLGQNITLSDAETVKRIERETRHDVKAMERAFRGMVVGTSLEDLTEMIHFGLTSEDVNNLAYRLMLKRATEDICLPVLDRIVDELMDWTERYKKVPMLGRTHGQPAVPTTAGKEFAVFAERLNLQTRGLEKRPLRGKLTGAVGNFNAHYFARPDVDWIKFSERFVRSLGFDANLITTQIDSPEDIIEYLQNYQRINGVLVDFDQDVWRYISDFWIVLEKRAGEVGSSTMPQKINPQDFEGSEGNLVSAHAISSNAWIENMARKLPMSRLQRDLSDSTVIRNLGVILGHSLLGYKNILAGASRMSLNEAQIKTDLNRDWVILAEGVQTLLRSEGVEDPYFLIASLTRGEHIGQGEWQEWVDGLPIDKDKKNAVRDLEPETYIGLAVKLSNLTRRRIKASRRRK